MSNIDQDQLNLALDAARMATWEWDVPAGEMRWCSRMYGLFGLAQEDFSGRYADFVSLLHADDRESSAAAMAASVRNGEEYDGEFRTIRRSDGSPRILRARAKVHQGNGAAGLRLIGVCWDVTRRRQAEHALATERRFLSMLTDHLPDGIYFKDLQSRFTFVNRAMANRCGLSAPAELTGKTDFDVFTAEHASKALEDERRILRTGEPMVNLEEKETWPDGHETWVSTTKMPVRDDAGRLIGTFGLSRDITLRKHAEQQLARVAEELRARNEMLEEDLEMARELQSALLPQYYPRFPRDATVESGSAVRFCHYYRPSTAVSGDFFEVLDISDDLAGLFICDVMGHGVRAAMVAAMIRALVRELRPSGTEPAEFLNRLNRALCDTLRDNGSALFASAFFVIADLAKGQLHYANAGHPLPFLVHHSGGSVTPHPLNGVKAGPALGLLDGAEYRTSHCAISQHDSVLLFTDGLFEVEDRDGESYGYPQLLGAVSRRSHLPANELCRGVVEEVQEFSADREFADDVCLVAMEIDRLVPTR